VGLYADSAVGAAVSVGSIEVALAVGVADLTADNGWRELGFRVGEEDGI
jgi:hypothetical protein